MNKKPKVTDKDKKETADKVAEVIKSFTTLVHQRDLTTFDLRDIRELILKHPKVDDFSASTFKSVFAEMWRVWPSD